MIKIDELILDLKELHYCNQFMLQTKHQKKLHKKLIHIVSLLEEEKYDEVIKEKYLEEGD